MWSRRQFLTAGTGGAFALGVGAFGYTWLVEPHWLEFTRQTMRVPNLPPELHGRILVQISDTHVGRTVDSNYLMDAFRRVAAFEPDWIALTGDYMTCVAGEEIDETARVFESLPRPRSGIVGVFGNHDYGRNYRRFDVADGIGRRFRDLGIEILSNEQRTLGGLTFVGLDDYWSPRFGPNEPLANIDHRRPNVVLCHNPDVADLPIWGSYRGWILSGHTHGGQCKPPFLPPPLLPVTNRRYTCGAFEVGPDRWMYVNRALGYLRRVRFNVRPEIAIFELQPLSTAADEI